jgi:hypothetical protein
MHIGDPNAMYFSLSYFKGTLASDKYCSLKSLCVCFALILARHKQGSGMLCRALFWVQQGALFEARLPGGHLQYRRATKLPSNGVDMICEDPEDDDIVPARRQQAEPENDCKIHLDVRTTLWLL